MSHRTPYNPIVGTYGGCVIYVRRDIPHVPLTLTTQLEAVAIQVDLGMRYTVCSLYLSPNISL